MSKPVESPCVSVCYVNDDDICEGCFRSIEEITYWSGYDNEAKQKVIKLSNERRKDCGWEL